MKMTSSVPRRVVRLVTAATMALVATGAVVAAQPGAASAGPSGPVPCPAGSILVSQWPAGTRFVDVCYVPAPGAWNRKWYFHYTDGVNHYIAPFAY